MENKTVKPTISERINARLKEPADAIFRDGKWRFWFVLVFGLSLASAIGTALIFPGAVGSLAMSMGVLLLWVFVGTLHYSDSDDARLARGVSILDSVALCFVIAHFCFVMWVLGHSATLREAESKFAVEAEAYNVKVADLSKDNVKITESTAKISDDTVKAEKLRNDTAYQQRKTIEGGGRIKASKTGPVAATALPSLTPIELEKPEKPAESSTAFLGRWDSWIRAANFGELILAAVTLIYIRNRSAKFNAQGLSEPVLSVATLSHKGRTPQAALRVSHAQEATVATDERQAALIALREHLRVIASYMPKRFFKADLIAGGVSIRMCRKILGADVTMKKTRQSQKLLDAVNRPDFQERLRAELIACGFPIGGGR